MAKKKSKPEPQRSKPEPGVVAFGRFFEGHFDPSLVRMKLDGDLSEGTYGSVPTAEGPGSVAICEDATRDQFDLGWMIPPATRGLSQGWIFPKLITEWAVSGNEILVRHHRPSIVPADDPLVQSAGALDQAERALKIRLSSEQEALSFTQEAEKLMGLERGIVSVREKKL